MILLLVCPIKEVPTNSLPSNKLFKIGVEAQTLTVWRQADRYNVPRIVYLNKMDKSGSNFHVCLKQIEDKLKCVPLPLHVPIGQGKDFSGIIDLVHLTTKVWESENKETLGAVFSTRLVPDFYF